MWKTLLYCPLFTGFLCSMCVTGLNVLRRASQFLHLDLTINYLLSVFKQHNCFNPLPVRPWFFLQHTTLRAPWRLYPEHVPCSLQLKKKTLGQFFFHHKQVQCRLSHWHFASDIFIGYWILVYLSYWLNELPRGCCGVALLYCWTCFFSHRRVI